MTDEREGLVFEVDSVTYRPNDRVASTPATGLAWGGSGSGRYPRIAGVWVPGVLVDADVCRFCRAYLDAVVPPRSRVCRNCQPLAVAEARR